MCRSPGFAISRPTDVLTCAEKGVLSALSELTVSDVEGRSRSSEFDL